MENGIKTFKKFSAGK